MKTRKLGDVIDRLLAIAPDLRPVLDPIKDSIGYTAPEVERVLWARVQEALKKHAAEGEHPRYEELRRVWNALDP